MLPPPMTMISVPSFTGDLLRARRASEVDTAACVAGESRR
jgi:hypothetical protein